MNYIGQIRGFYDLQLSKPFSTGQIALWHALMHINNKCSWIEWFTAANLTLELLSGLSRQGIVKSRNELKQQGLIDFKSNGTKATSYTIKLLYMSNSVQAGIQDGVQNSVQDGVQDGVQNSGTLNKLNKTKLNKKKDTNVSPKKKDENFIPPTLDEVRAYCLKRGNSVDPKRFFDFFDVSGWIDSNGNPVKSWKQKVITWEGRNSAKHNVGNTGANAVGGDGGGEKQDAPKYGTVY